GDVVADVAGGARPPRPAVAGARGDGLVAVAQPIAAAGERLLQEDGERLGKADPRQRAVHPARPVSPVDPVLVERTAAVDEARAPPRRGRRPAPRRVEPATGVGGAHAVVERALAAAAARAVAAHGTGPGIALYAEPLVAVVDEDLGVDGLDVEQ